MTDSEIIKEIEDFTGYDFSIKDRSRDKAFARKATVILIYKFAEGYLSQKSISKKLHFSNRSQISLIKNDFNDVIKYDNIHSENFKVLHDLISENTNEREVFKDVIDLEYHELKIKFLESKKDKERLQSTIYHKRRRIKELSDKLFYFEEILKKAS